MVFHSELPFLELGGLGIVLIFGEEKGPSPKDHNTARESLSQALLSLSLAARVKSLHD